MREREQVEEMLQTDNGNMKLNWRSNSKCSPASSIVLAKVEDQPRV